MFHEVFNAVDIKDRIYTTVYFRADDITKKFKRTTYSMLDFLSDIGGIL